MLNFALFLKECDIDANEAKKNLSTVLVGSTMNFEQSDAILFVYDQLQKMENALKTLYGSYDRQYHRTKKVKAQNEQLRRRLAKVGDQIRNEVGVGKKKRSRTHRVIQNSK